MTGPGLPTPGSAAAENELLARLGLPKSASPEDLDDLHQAVSQYLASAPPELRGWAHAQAAALDEAYLQLTDPVGFGGSTLRSPARPPAVVPGGPATPPARRGSDPAADPIPTDASAAASAGAMAAASTDAMADEPDVDAGIELAAGDDPDVDDLALLYASVTPSAHPDMLPDSKPKAKAAAPVAVAAVAVPARPGKTTHSRRAARPAAVAAAPAPPAANPWKRLVIAGLAVVAIVGVGFAGMQVVGAIGGSQPTPSDHVAVGTQAPPAVDQAKIGELMTKLAANPQDTVTMMALADEYYAGQQFEQAGEFLDKILAIEPESVQALLARGAVAFNLGKLDEAQATWTKVVVIDPNNVEAHYDLGFLYLNSATPDWAGVQREWNKVIELDPTSDLAKTVKSHLDSLAAASMIPGGAPAASAGTSAAPSTAPSAAPSAPPAATAAPSASPAASTVP